VDVGFGDSFLEPLRLEAGLEQEQTQSQVPYRRGSGRMTVERQRKKGQPGVESAVQFALVPRQLAEFAGMCHHHQTSPDSHFTRQRICTLATPEGPHHAFDFKLIARAVRCGKNARARRGRVACGSSTVFRSEIVKRPRQRADRSGRMFGLGPRDLVPGSAFLSANHGTNSTTTFTYTCAETSRVRTGQRRRPRGFQKSYGMATTSGASPTRRRRSSTSHP